MPSESSPILPLLYESRLLESEPGPDLKRINKFPGSSSALPKISLPTPVTQNQVPGPSYDQLEQGVIDPPVLVPCPVLKTSSHLLKSSKLSSGMEVVKELVLAVVFGLWGIFVHCLVACVPRRFRYKDVTDQVILITGAGSGIGRMMARKFALDHKAIVVAWDINQKGNEETVKDIVAAGGKCHGYVVDVSSREAIYKAAEKVKVEVGKVDILINNAGIVSGKRLLETPDESIIKTFEVNAISNFWTTKAFLPAMLETGRGHIVTIASMAGLFGTNRLVDYCASKFAAVGFDEALKNEIKVELGQEQIHATLVCPYYINTGMFDGVRSKVIPLLTPEPVVDDIVAGILTNQEQIIIPRYVYALIVFKLLLPGAVGRRLATAFGITGAMLTFKGGDRTKAADTTTASPKTVAANGNGSTKSVKNGRKSK